MRPNNKTGSLILENWGEQSVVRRGARKSKHPGLEHFIVAYSQAPKGVISPRLLKHGEPIVNPMTGFIHHPASYGRPEVETTDVGVLELPADLTAPALIAISAVANMHPLRSYLQQADRAHAQQILSNFWQQTFNEDSPLYHP
jgi:hypothetical protein